MIALCSIQHLMLWRSCCLEPKNERATKDSSVGAFVKRMENYSAQELLEKKVKYHKSCFSRLPMQELKKDFETQLKQPKFQLSKEKQEEHQQF